MAVDDEGIWKNPAFLGSGAPEVDVDPTEVSDYFAAVAGAVFDTVADGLGETPPDDNFLFRAKDAPGAWFEFLDSGWVMHGIPAFEDATARDATLSSPAEGDRCALASTGEQRFNGSAWLPYPESVVLVARTVFTTQSTIDVTGLTGFHRYTVDVFSGVSSADNALEAQLLDGSSPDSTASSYYLDNLTASAGSVSSASPSATTKWSQLTVGNRPKKRLTLELINLNDAEETWGQYAGDTGAGVRSLARGMLRHTVAAAFNGVRILTSSGTISGWYTVVGHGA